MKRLFGTDGVRGVAGEPPLDAATLRALGRAVAQVLASDLAHAARIVIGRDTRESGPAVVDALASGLVAAGASVRSAGVIPTPGVALLARSEDFDVGLVASASHNPWRDNGVKIFSSEGTKLPDDVELRIESLVAELRPSSAGMAAPFHLPDEPELVQRHASWLVRRGLAAGGAAGLRVVADCANGAASPIARDVLEGVGAEVDVVADAPDGRNINDGCGSLHLEGLARRVVETGADLGVAFDGDADRALFVDRSGSPVDGDHVLLIAADLLQRAGRLRGGAVVGTVMSNFGLERALASRGIGLVRERVGDRNVLLRMAADGCNLGGEQSGHVIFLDEAPTGDGLLTALQVLAAVREAGRPLGELAAGLARSPQVLRNVRARRRVALADVPGHAELVAAWSRRLGDDGRILVRWSGTEPLVRVMAEGTDAALIARCADEIAAQLAAEIGDDACPS